jgi:hypothetical protein
MNNKLHAGGVIASCENSAAMISLLGYAHHFEGVGLTHDEFKACQKLYQFHDEENPLLQAGMCRDIGRAMSRDGKRIIALIAKYCEPGQDPVEFIQELLDEAGMAY